MGHRGSPALGRSPVNTFHMSNTINTSGMLTPKIARPSNNESLTGRVLTDIDYQNAEPTDLASCVSAFTWLDLNRSVDVSSRSLLPQGENRTEFSVDYTGSVYNYPESSNSLALDYLSWMLMTTSDRTAFQKWSSTANIEYIAAMLQRRPYAPKDKYHPPRPAGKGFRALPLTMHEVAPGVTPNVVAAGRGYATTIHSSIQANASKWTDRQLRLATCIALPLEPTTVPCRPRTDGSLCNTAVFQLVGTSILPATTGYDSSGNWRGDCPPGQFFSVAFRNPLRALVYSDPNTSGQQSIYGMMFTSGTNLVSTTQLAVGAYQWANIPVAQLNASTTYQPHGPILYTGRTTKRQYFWVDTRATVTLQIVSGSSSSIISLTLYRYSNGTETALNTNNNTTANWTVTQSFSSPGYYAFDVSVNLANTYLTVSGTVTNSFWHTCHMAVPELATALTTCTQFRAVGSAILASNLTPVINLGGAMAACSFPGSLDWMGPALAGYSYVASRSKSAIRSQPAADPGLYKVILPGSMDDLEMHSYSYGSNNSSATSYDLTNEAQYVVNIVASPGTPASPVSISLQYRYGGVWEALTTSPLLETSTSTLSTAQTEEVYDATSALDDSYGNPIHVAAILNTLFSVARAGVGWLARNAPGLGSAIGQVANTVQQVAAPFVQAPTPPPMVVEAPPTPVRERAPRVVRPRTKVVVKTVQPKKKGPTKKKKNKN